MPRRRYDSDQELLFPDVSAPGAVFYRVKFLFMGYHPEDGEFIKTFVAPRVRGKNQDEAIQKALEIARQRYSKYFFEYRLGPHIGSGAWLVYSSRTTRHTFVRARSQKEALSVADGSQAFFIQVTPCP